MVGGHTVAAQQGKVFDIGSQLSLLTIHAVDEANFLGLLAWNPVPQGEGFPGGRATIALRTRKFLHSWVEQPGALGS